MELIIKADSADKTSYLDLGEHIFDAVKDVSISSPLILFCIGTDRCSGDSLGPFVGHSLVQNNLNNFYIFGTLETPIHAKNINTYIEKVKNLFNNPFIIAIDASLGQISDVGKILFKNKPVSPGLALNKKLPSVGNLSLTGVVNMSGNFEFMLLQNTRLYTISLLAETISKSIVYADKLLTKFSKKNSLNVSQETFLK